MVIGLCFEEFLVCVLSSCGPSFAFPKLLYSALVSDLSFHY